MSNDIEGKFTLWYPEELRLILTDLLVHTDTHPHMETVGDCACAIWMYWKLVMRIHNEVCFAPSAAPSMKNLRVGVIWSYDARLTFVLIEDKIVARVTLRDPMPWETFLLLIRCCRYRLIVDDSNILLKLTFDTKYPKLEEIFIPTIRVSDVAAIAGRHKYKEKHVSIREHLIGKCETTLWNPNVLPMLRILEHVDHLEDLRTIHALRTPMYDVLSISSTDTIATNMDEVKEETVRKDTLFGELCKRDSVTMDDIKIMAERTSVPLDIVKRVVGKARGTILEDKGMDDLQYEKTFMGRFGVDFDIVKKSEMYQRYFAVGGEVLGYASLEDIPADILLGCVIYQLRGTVDGFVTVDGKIVCIIEMKNRMSAFATNKYDIDQLITYMIMIPGELMGCLAERCGGRTRTHFYKQSKALRVWAKIKRSLDRSAKRIHRMATNPYTAKTISFILNE
jgi:hypothetical protein